MGGDVNGIRSISRETRRAERARLRAKGGGKIDDTSAFQKAIDAAHEMGGNIVFVPRGDYLIAGTLEVREQVTLEGVFRGPFRPQK